VLSLRYSSLGTLLLFSLAQFHLLTFFHYYPHSLTNHCDDRVIVERNDFASRGPEGLPQRTAVHFPGKEGDAKIEGVVEKDIVEEVIEEGEEVIEEEEEVIEEEEENSDDGEEANPAKEEELSELDESSEDTEYVGIGS
jgi:hypothetical protein